MKKVIGIIARPNLTIGKRECFSISNHITKIIDELGAISLGIIPTNASDVIFMIDKCDGIILQGGDDILPIDLEIVRYLYEKDIPTLGICLGMQIMNNDGCIGVLNHLDTNHLVNINKSSLLYQIFNRKVIEVNSHHKSAIIESPYDVSAYSDDGIIEAIEDKNKKFFLGVQWHPELDPINLEIFVKFLNECENK